MAQIYGELIRAQLQVSSSALSPTATGLVYFNSGTGTDAGLNWYAGSAWKTAVDLNSLQTLSTKTLDATCVISSAASLPLVTLAKGGLGADASAWSGVLKASGGTISAATIVNADISATAAIDATKIASGAVSNFKFDKLNTAGSNGPDLLVNTDGTQNLTNKRLIGCRVDDWSDFSEETTSQASPSGGLLRIYAKNDHKLYKIWDGGVETEIGSGGGGTVDSFIQASPVLAVGDAVYLNGSVYTKAIATSAAAAEVVGVISKDPATLGTDNYEITLSGEVTGLTGLTAGEVYFLSAATAGLLTVTEPSTVGQVSVPVGIASSTTSLYVAPKRGVVIGGTNARANVSLTSGATTSVQNLAGYDAGELTGWVFISSAAPVRFYVSAKFAKSGAGGDYNLSYQTTGDVPPVGFSLQISTSGLLSCTLPASSGSTSVINYALNAPAIGASFPLTVDAGTILSGTVASARLPAPSAYANADATRMGLKQYLHGTTYNGGIAPTVSYISGGGTATINRCTFVPYQLQDGGWRVKFNIDVSLSATTRTAVAVQINGITAANATQAVVGFLTGSVVPPRAVLGSASNQITCDFASNIIDSIRLSGDVELASKPTWAY